jgi:hypothetical protein
LGLSQEHVERYGELFFRAIEFYGRSLVRREENKPYIAEIRDLRLSLILELRNLVQRREELPSGNIVRLLGEVLRQYRTHLLELKKKPWVKQDAIEKLLAQIDEIAKEDLVKIG